MATIEQTVRSIRSKNAGPFWLTIDAFCKNEEDTDKVANAFEREKSWVADVFKVPVDTVRIFNLKHIQVVKISVPRLPIEGSRDERDMHGGQQYVTLLDIEV